MNRVLPTVLILCLGTASVNAQFNPPGITKASLAYHDFRMKDTTPSYGLAKVQKLIAKTPKRDVPDSDSSKEAVTQKQFDSLSVPERFTYCMIHGEDFGQNCDGMPGFLNEEKLIFSHPIGDGGGEEMLSDRQTAFLHNHRSAVIKLLRQTMLQKEEVGCNFKQAIIEIDAYELIPDMIKVFQKTRKDGDILSTLDVLMVSGKYQPFLKSATYKKLYGKDSNYQSTIVFNNANKDLTIQRAMAYYKTRITK